MARPGWLVPMKKEFITVSLCKGLRVPWYAKSLATEGYDSRKVVAGSHIVCGLPGFARAVALAGMICKPAN